MSKKLYKIWHIQHNMDKPCNSIYIKVEFDPNKRTWAYLLCDVLNSFPRLSRYDVISIDFEKINNTCQYLNDMADEDVTFEVREDEQIYNIKDSPTA